MTSEIPWSTAVNHIRITGHENRDERVSQWLRAREECGFETRIQDVSSYYEGGDTILRIEYNHRTKA